MSIDASLLNAGIESDQTFLRLYRWERATVSLGYFQKSEQFKASGGPLSQLPTVQRLSGGGAILHEHEWTYTLVTPGSRLGKQDPLELYTAVHTSLIEVFERRGLICQLRGHEAAFDSEQFLCFGRGDARDIVCGTHKVVGSAQRRRRGAVLQHGSILIRHSSLTPQYPGLADLGASGPWGPEFASEVSCRIIEAFRLEPVSNVTTPEVSNHLTDP